MAQALLQGAIGGPGRKSPPGTPSGLSPQSSRVEIKALACELPATLGLPLSRLSVADVARHAERSGLVARISDSTVWRWLHEDAIRPWQHRCWIFPRDPHFQAKAGRILDLYERRWQGKPLREDEFVISTDEKTSIQARLRIHPSLRPTAASRCAWSTSTGAAAPGPTWPPWTCIEPRCSAAARRPPASRRSQRLVDQVMSQPPYNEPRDACSGSWITARRIAARHRCGG